MKEQMFQIQRMLADKLDRYRERENSYVVATTCHNSTCSLLTSAKLSDSYLVVGRITRELDKKPLLHLSSIYTWLLVHATTIFIWPLSPCFYLMSYYSSTCVYLKATMLPTCALISYPLPYSIVLCHLL